MKSISRRQFIDGILGATMISQFRHLSAKSNRDKSSALKAPKINLSECGIKISRLAMGTGTDGWNQVSDQTRLRAEF